MTGAAQLLAGLRVGDGLGSWGVGGAIAFVDSFEHEVWNDSDEDRLVFIVDCWHPALRTDEQRRAALGSHDDALASTANGSSPPPRRCGRAARAA